MMLKKFYDIDTWRLIPLRRAGGCLGSRNEPPSRVETGYPVKNYISLWQL
jgi:hypothetical protein